MWFFEDGPHYMLDITERASEENDCSTAIYKIEKNGRVNYKFTLVKNWSERDLPNIIDGEFEFRKMINKF